MGEKIIPFESIPPPEDLLEAVKSIDFSLEQMTAYAHDQIIIDSPDQILEEPFETHIYGDANRLHFKRSSDGRRCRIWQISIENKDTCDVSIFLLSAASHQPYIGKCDEASVVPHFPAPTNLELNKLLEIIEQAKSESGLYARGTYHDNVLPFLKKS